MKGWLLDTDILSATGPSKRPLPEPASQWFRERTDSLYFSTITLTEVEAGIARLRRTGAGQRADNLRAWFDRIVDNFAERILPFDIGAASIAGPLGDAAVAAGRHPGFADVAIAAIAKAHDLAVVTLNRRHFEPLGVDLADPFAAH